MASKRRRQTKRLRWQGMDPVVHNLAVRRVKGHRLFNKRYILSIGGLVRSFKLFGDSADRTARHIIESFTALNKLAS